MIQIRNQTEFDELVRNTPSNQKIFIYPRRDGAPYTLSEPWNISSQAFIEGVNAPTIKQIGGSLDDAEMIKISSTSESVLKDIVIKNLRLLAKPSDGSDITCGIKCEYVGFTNNDNFDNDDYGASYVGYAFSQEKGISIIDCYFDGFINAIIMNNTHNSIVIGNTIKNSLMGLNISEESTTIVIDGNTFENCDESFSAYGNSRYISFSNNMFYPGSSAGTCVNITSSKCITVSSNTIKNADRGIYLDSSRFNIVSENIIDSTKDNSILMVESSNNTLSGNHIANCTTTGVKLTNTSANNTVIGNLLNDNHSSGIDVVGTDRSIPLYLTIIGNTLYESDSYGISFTNVASSTLLHNAFTNNVIGLSFIDSDYNFLYGNTLYASVFENTSITGVENEFDTLYNRIIDTSEE